MRKFDLPLFTDIVFYSISAWLVLVGLLRWLRAQSWVCFTAATLLSLALGIILFLILSSRHKRRSLNKKEQELQEKLMLHLALERDERVRATLLEALIADGKDAHCEKDALSVDGVPLIPIFTMQPVSADAVARLLKEYGTENFCIACNTLSSEAEKLLSSFSRTALQGTEIFELLRRTDKIPDPLICGEIPRKTAKYKLHRAFSKRNAYPFFVSGAGLLIMSLYVFFPVYYLIAGSILLCASILIRAFGYAA